MIPLMVSILKLGRHQAHGISLVAPAFTGLGGMLTCGLHRGINFPAAGMPALAAIFAD